MCDTLWTEAVDRVRPDLVFLTVADPGAVEREVDRQWTTPCDERFDRYLRGKLTAAVDTLSATGATVVLGTSVRAMPTYANGVIPEHLDCFNQTIRSVVAADPGRAWSTSTGSCAPTAPAPTRSTAAICGSTACTSSTPRPTTSTVAGPASWSRSSRRH